MTSLMSLTKLQNPDQEGVDKLRKVNGNYKPTIIPPLERWGNIISSPKEIANIFADQYVNISRDSNKKSKPDKNRKRKKEDELPNNKSLAVREITIKQ